MFLTSPYYTQNPIPASMSVTAILQQRPVMVGLPEQSNGFRNPRPHKNMQNWLDHHHDAF